MMKMSIILMLASILHICQGHIITTKVITVSNEPVATLKSKFKETEVRLSSKTLTKMTNSSMKTIEEIPDITINSSGMIERKFYKLEEGYGLYLFFNVMDSQ